MSLTAPSIFREASTTVNLVEDRAKTPCKSVVVRQRRRPRVYHLLEDQEKNSVQTLLGKGWNTILRL
jgi:hypothetical protein